MILLERDLARASLRWGLMQPAGRKDGLVWVDEERLERVLPPETEVSGCPGSTGWGVDGFVCWLDSLEVLRGTRISPLVHPEKRLSLTPTWSVGEWVFIPLSVPLPDFPQRQGLSTSSGVEKSSALEGPRLPGALAGEKLA